VRINVYSQELTPEVQHVEKEANTGVVYHAAMLMLHSSPMLHHPPHDDDRSGVTFWLPKSQHRREEMARHSSKSRRYSGTPRQEGWTDDFILWLIAFFSALLFVAAILRPLFKEFD
jgi:hypothetical protein